MCHPRVVLLDQHTGGLLHGLRTNARHLLMLPKAETIQSYHLVIPGKMVDLVPNDNDSFPLDILETELPFLLSITKRKRKIPIENSKGYKKVGRARFQKISR